jgi:hypothetical protein
MKRALVIMVGVGAICAGCGSSSSGSGGSSPSASDGTPASSSDPTATITKNWQTFFNYQTSTAAREALLEDGSTLGPAMALGDKFGKKEHLQETATVSKVKLTDSTHATVSYSISSHGSVLFPDGTGYALLQNGQWVVAKQTFCTLIQLGASGQAVPGC